MTTTPCTTCKGAGRVKARGYEVLAICSACQGTGKTNRPTVPIPVSQPPEKS